LLISKATGDVNILNISSKLTPIAIPYIYIPNIPVPAFILAKANSFALSVARERRADRLTAESTSLFTAFNILISGDIISL
jgi:hypothetical protein